MILDYYLDLDVIFLLSDHIPTVPTTPGTSITWHYLRNQTTVENLLTEKTLRFIRSQTGLYNLKTEQTLQHVRQQITFYRNYEMANQDPFEISIGGKLVNNKIFLNPLRTTGDTLLSDETIVPSQSATGFTVGNIRRNSATLVNEDGISFPVNTVILFDVEAPDDPDEDLDEALLFFEFQSTAGLKLKISHPIQIKDAIEAR